MAESWRDIRPIAIGIVRRGEDLLVGEEYDPTADERFYRPLGGGIGFGEPAVDALRREFREEVDLELTDVQRLATVENIFTFDGEQGHEFVAVFEASLVDETIYDREELTGYEESHDAEFRVVWKSLSAFESGEEILYPDGLVDIARETA
jgi:ADP-ribose pyrophosphatase YjhB (NUDIX family)